jgi:hypothetical protein
MRPHPSRSKRWVSLWHEGFAECVRERAPAGFQTTSEFLLSLRPRRADLLLLRRTDRAGDQGRILRGLWPRLARATLVEFKSPSRDFRSSDLIRLASYGAQYHAERMDRDSSPDDLTLVLVMPCCNQSLSAELERMRWRLRDLGDGYAQVVGAWYTTLVVFTNHVAEAEQDDLLRVFSDLDVQTIEVRHWLESWLIMKDTGHDVKDREGYDAMLEKLLRSIPLEKRLAGIPPEQRLAGIPPEQTLLALPDDVLRGLPDEYIRSLPGPVQSAIHERLARPRGR